MSSFIDEFLVKSVLGRNVDLNSSESVIEHCISKAYDDMMTVGRFYKLQGKSERCEEIKKCFEKSKYCFSVELIEQVAALFIKEKLDNRKSYVTTFGLAQKVVNMTFKYLYCFHDFIQLDIDFTKCDCPIDSIVLNQMKSDKLLKSARSSYVWSKLTDTTYDELQKALDNQTGNAPDGLPPCSPRLRYDFNVW